MKHMFKFLLAGMLFFGAVESAMAQSKPGCDPKSCGPDNTKVEEAKVITDLRDQLQSAINKMGSSSYAFDKGIKTYQIPKGSSDDESVLFISQTITCVKRHLKATLPEEKILIELKEGNPALTESKQQVIAQIKKDILFIEKQINQL